jgi:phytoene synthase
VTPQDECLALVRSHDRDRYLSTLFAPDAARPHLIALYAFNAEILKVRDSVTEPQIGLIRLQWWRDTVDALCEGKGGSGHPVAEALGPAIEAGELPAQALHDLVTAHEFDLYHDRMPGLTELEAYLGETSSRLIQMAAMLIDREKAQAVSDAAGLAGVAHGLTVILGDPRRREPFLPQGLDVTAAIAHAEKRLAEARALLPMIPKPLLPAFLPVSLTSLYLGRIAKAQEKPLAVSALRRQLTMWWHARRDTF